MHHDFSETDRWAAQFDAPDREAWQKPAEVVALLQLEPRDVVVDLGAGTGYFLKHLATAVPDGKVLALDSEHAMVTHMTNRIRIEKLSNVEARVVRPNGPDLAARSVNKILVVNTWHHIPERAAYAAKLHAALACNGALAIVDFTAESPIGPPVAGRIAPAAIVDELRGAGFEPRIVDEPLPHQYMIVGTARCN